MAEQRFKVGDRVVDPNGGEAVIRRVLADGWVAADGDRSVWRSWVFRPATAHPWASELRKFALQDTQNVTDGVAHQVHPFCNTGKPRGKDVTVSAHVREQINGWCVLEQRSAIRSSSPCRFSLYEAKP